MVVCALIVICAVIAASKGMFSASRIDGYDDAKYTAGATKLQWRVDGNPVISVLKQLMKNKRCYFASYALYFPEHTV